MAELINEEYVKQQFKPILSALLDDTLAAAVACGKKLLSGALYGSAVTKDYNPDRSDVNVYFVFDAMDLALLKALRDVFKKHNKKLKANPVALDAEYIKDSRDVFPIEFLEWKEKSVIFHGEDMLRNLEISNSNLRIEIEQNLRGKRMRMIQSFFELDPRKKQIQPFLIRTLPNFIVMARNVLRLLGAVVSSDTLSMIAMLERKAAVEMPTFKRLVQMKSENLKVGDAEIEIMFKEFLAEIDRLILFVDGYKA